MKRKQKSIFKKIGKKARQRVGIGVATTILAAGCTIMGYIGGMAEGERRGRRAVLDDLHKPTSGRYPWGEEEESEEAV